jgi:acyl-CoA reductase-like NAD-dependent aldehyde dehydrogenase
MYGRCVIKPPDATPATSALLAELIGAAVAREAVAVVEGGASVCEALIDCGYDHIMFTGGGSIGKLVMARAAATLTPGPRPMYRTRGLRLRAAALLTCRVRSSFRAVTLELGGKNPVMIDEMDDEGGRSHGSHSARTPTASRALSSH